MKLDSVIIEPKNPATACVIWLHGLGADGHDFVPALPELELPENHSIRFIFPHAPMRPITLNMGMTMRAWYDIVSLDFGQRQDKTGIQTSATLIQQYIQQQEALNIASNRIFLVGFSQGGAMALYTGLRYPQRLAGIVGLSCYLPLAESLPEEAHPANQKTPIFLAHGEQDPLLPPILGEGSRDFLRELQYSVEWQSYPMAHTVCAEELQAVGRMIQKVL